MPKQRPQRCNAQIRRNDARLNRAAREGRLSEYLRRSRERCRNWPVRGSKRCRFHGGHSTGPTTPDGMARTLAAMKAGRARWLAQLKSEGKPIPCGRKKGGRNLPAEEREQAAYEKRCHRKARPAPPNSGRTKGAPCSGARGDPSQDGRSCTAEGAHGCWSAVLDRGRMGKSLAPCRHSAAVVEGASFAKSVSLSLSLVDALLPAS